MAKYCTSCGKEIAEEVAFCTECGAEVSIGLVQNDQPESNEAISGEFIERDVLEAQPQPQPQLQLQPHTVNQKQKPVADNMVVGTGTYFGLMLLFAIPVIGLISVILLSFLPKNKNIKNYARAMLIWTVILFVFTCIIVGLCVAFASVFVGMLNDITNGAAGEIMEQFGDAGESFKGIEEISEQLKNGGLEGLPLK